jgi:hypothetical protein
MRQLAMATLALLALASTAGVGQDVRRDIGVLTCELAESKEARSGTELGSQRQTREMVCAFRPGNNSPEEIYTGTVQSLVEDKPLTHNRVMIWIVKGSLATTESAGLLQQIYAADPSAPLGQAPALIGESNVSIVLQPMADSKAPTTSDGRQPPVGALVVFVALKLRSTPT